MGIITHFHEVTTNTNVVEVISEVIMVVGIVPEDLGMVTAVGITTVEALVTNVGVTTMHVVLVGTCVSTMYLSMVTIVTVDLLQWSLDLRKMHRSHVMAVDNPAILERTVPASPGVVLQAEDLVLGAVATILVVMLTSGTVGHRPIVC